MGTTITFKKATAAEWTSSNPVLASGEPGIETDTTKIKIGNGSQAWDLLTYINEAPYSPSFSPALVRSYQGVNNVNGQYMGRNIGISDSRVVILHYDDLNADENAKIKVYSSSSGTLERTMVNPDTVNYKNFGYLTGPSKQVVFNNGGDYLAVGALHKTNNLRSRVTIHQISTGSLIHTFEEDNTNPANIEFNQYNFMSDTYLITADPTHDSNTGRITIRKTDSGDWTDTSVVGTVGPGYSSATKFGETASIFGDLAIIGGRFWTNSTYAQGRAFIVNLSTGTLLDTIENPSPDGNAVDYFGIDVVMMDANTVAVGSKYEDDTADNGGAVYIFRSASGNWNDTTLIKTLTPPNVIGPDATNDRFGTFLAADEGYLLVGATHEGNATFPNNAMGTAFVFKTTTGTWEDLDQYIYFYLNPESTFAAGEIGNVQIDVSQDIMLISHPLAYNTASAISAGTVHQFTLFE